MPHLRYKPAHERVALPQSRSWPTKRHSAAPLWVPVDLRDGNQALAEPMDSARKLIAFDLQTSIGFKEIEVGYPSASALDFDFVRRLVRDDLVPDDVTVVVFTAARRDLIERTFQAIDGLTRAVVHVYAATAPTWRDVVLGVDRADLLKLVTRAGEDVLACDDRLKRTDTRFQFSPEVFNLTEPDFALAVCNEMTRVWDATPERPVIHNLPATVEISTPNVYADQIEYMHDNLDRRDSVILSVHPHNDRGTGVACAELALLAGAQRVEGCLFGNGERTGNVDLVTLALNMFSQGIDPMLDLSDIDRIREIVEGYNEMPVHPRHPYAGELVYTAFSGTHQDAISKGFAHHAARAQDIGQTPELAPWDVPYLPIDPADVGRTYQAVIRVNSQSGKGGVAYLLEAERGVHLPQGLRHEFARVVQDDVETHANGGEIGADRLWELFMQTYLHETDRCCCPGTVETQCHCRQGAAPCDTVGAAADNGWYEVLREEGHPLPDGTWLAYVEIVEDGRARWGAGRCAHAQAAGARAVESALRR